MSAGIVVLGGGGTVGIIAVIFMKKKVRSMQ